VRMMRSITTRDGSGRPSRKICDTEYAPDGRHSSYCSGDAELSTLRRQQNWPDHPNRLRMLHKLTHPFAASVRLGGAIPMITITSLSLIIQQREETRVARDTSIYNPVNDQPLLSQGDVTSTGPQKALEESTRTLSTLDFENMHWHSVTDNLCPPCEP
jgi:hypothetical protein